MSAEFGHYYRRQVKVPMGAQKRAYAQGMNKEECNGRMKQPGGLSNDVELYIQTHAGPLNASYVFQDHSQMDTASSYVWLPHHSV